MAVVAVTVFGSLALVPVASAYNPLDGACAGGTVSEVCANKDEKVEPVLGVIVNTLLYIVGAISVLVIIIAGISYTISGGDSGKVAKAKNTLLYAIVGLVVAFIAFALVNWVFALF